MNPKTYQRFFRDPGTHYFLFGPRGTGKSTWARAHYEDPIWIDLLDPAEVRFYQAKPERLREVVYGEPAKQTVVIDEIQKVPELLSVVHLLIEEKNLKFVLTGSSSRKLKRSGVDLLGGRALPLTMHPFMAAELGENFDLEQALVMGMLPLVLDSPVPLKVLRGYASIYLQEEVQAEGLVRNVGNFSRFLETISFSHASMLNTSHVARECHVERKTVEGYISILEDLLLAYRIPVFSRRAKRKVISHPKFYLFDAGVYRSLRPSGPIDRPEEFDGHGLEGLVAQHLRAWIGYSKSECSLYFWRTSKGVEVDFVVYGQDHFYAIEVKNSKNVSRLDVRGLKSFREDYPESHPLLLYRGDKKQIIDGVLCLPCDEFLLRLRPDNDLCPA